MALRGWVTLGVIVGACVFAACSSGSGGGSGNQALPCGTEVCNAHQVCDESGKQPLCECQAAYTGADCETCAPGYEDVGGACLPLKVDCEAANPCGTFGVCVQETGKPDRCDCLENHTGPTCAQCDTGYQDNDENGTCEIGCDNPTEAPQCDAPRVCDEVTGSALCACPIGTQGERCELCEDNYARRGDEPCYQTCSHPDVTCVEPQFCFDDSGHQAASCVCEVGYTGATCSECDTGFTKQGEYCVRADLSGIDLLSVAKVNGRNAIVGVNATSGALTPLRTNSSAEGLVYDSIAKRLYVANYQGALSLDLASGEATLIAAEQIGHGKPLAWDSRSNVLLSLRSSDYKLLAIDPGSGNVTERGDTATSWVWDATFDPGSSTLYLLRAQGGTPEVFSVDPDTGAATQLGVVAELSAMSSEALGGIAALASGDLAITARQTMTTDEAALAACREAADRLGFDGYAAAPGSVKTNDQGDSTLSASKTSGVEIVAYRSYSRNAPSTLTLNVTNPDAFVCIATYEEDLIISVPASASWAGGLVYNYRASVNANVASGFQTTHPLQLLGGSEANLLGAAGYPQAFRLLSTQEGYDRRLPSLTDFDSYKRGHAPYRLLTVTPPALSVKSSVAIQGELAGALSTF
ncbi:MAG: hypothetical protein AB7S68_35900 [Polyangiaceae bacterium]